MSFANKVVLITGASAGIGANAAIRFANEGAKLAIIGRNKEKLYSVAKICEQSGTTVLPIVADVREDAEVKSAVQQTIEKFGKLDILVNNAGVLRESSILDDKYMESYDLIFNTNMRAVALLTNLAAPHIVKTNGNIINISSISANVVLKNFSAYQSSKAAMNHFTRSIALDLAQYGVRVNSISPGMVRTDIFKTAGLQHILEHCSTPLGKILESEEISDIIMYLASDKAKSITGSNYRIDNGTSLILPSIH